MLRLAARRSASAPGAGLAGGEKKRVSVDRAGCFFPFWFGFWRSSLAFGVAYPKIQHLWLVLQGDGWDASFFSMVFSVVLHFLPDSGLGIPSKLGYRRFSEKTPELTCLQSYLPTFALPLYFHGFSLRNSSGKPIRFTSNILMAVFEAKTAADTDLNKFITGKKATPRTLHIINVLPQISFERLWRW